MSQNTRPQPDPIDLAPAQLIRMLRDGPKALRQDLAATILAAGVPPDHAARVRAELWSSYHTWLEEAIVPALEALIRPDRRHEPRTPAPLAAAEIAAAEDALHGPLDLVAGTDAELEARIRTRLATLFKGRRMDAELIADLKREINDMLPPTTRLSVTVDPDDPNRIIVRTVGYVVTNPDSSMYSKT